MRSSYWRLTLTKSPAKGAQYLPANPVKKAVVASVLARVGSRSGPKNGTALQPSAGKPARHRCVQVNVVFGSGVIQPCCRQYTPASPPPWQVKPWNTATVFVWRPWVFSWWPCCYLPWASGISRRKGLTGVGRCLCRRCFATARASSPPPTVSLTRIIRARRPISACSLPGCSVRLTTWLTCCPPLWRRPGSWPWSTACWCPAAGPGRC